jgi:hypothetical protein
MTDITHPALTTTLNKYDLPTNSLSTFHTNIHSLPDKYLLLIEHLSQYNNQPDLIALSDNYLNIDTNPNSFPINGYYHKHIPDITVYYKTSIHISFLDIIIPQAATIILQIHKTERKTDPIHTIINIYRRPHHDITQFTNDLQTAIDNILTKHPRTSITIQGDINIDLFRLTPAHPFTKLLLTNNLHTTITTPTRYDPHHHNTKTLIDVILTTLTETHITSGTISPPLSDHLSIYAIIHNPPPRHQQNKQPTLSTGQYNKIKDTFLDELKHAITTTSAATATTPEHFHNIQQTIKHIIEKHETIPKQQRRKPWCDPHLKKQLQEQHLLHQRRIQQPSEHNIAKHKRCKHELKLSIRKAKQQQLETQLHDTKNNPKQQANILKSLIPSRSQRRTSPTTIIYENITYTEPTDIANALNDRFITIGHKTSETIPQAAPPLPKEEEEKKEEDRPPPSFKLNHTTTEIVAKTMKNINPNKANDIFKIKPIILKELADFLSPHLTILYNNAIDENRYPDPLKVTKLIELYKCKNKTDPANYRPISLLPIIAKIFDTIINSQLMTHLTTHNIISPTQYAFRPDSSTTLALQTIINNIHKNRKNKQPLLAIYVDLSKAYDTVSHDKLLHKLRHQFNFTASTTDFFASYFHNRQQSTHTQHAQSKMKTITHGIPQGSTLSTTLFLLYINDIINTTPKSKVYTYADDTTLVITADSVHNLQTLAQSELNNLINYFHSNNLVPNPTKTNYSVFYPQNLVDHSINLEINGEPIEQNSSARLLGLMIQDNLKHHQTINNIIKKLQPTIHSFRYANKLISTNWMIKLYYTHIYPHLINGISIWGSKDNNKTYLQPLIITQKKIIRLLKNLPPRVHTAPLMTELNILNLPNLYILRVCVEMHPFIHPRTQPNRPQHNHYYTLTSNIHNYPTRYSRDGHLFIPNTNKYSLTQRPKHTTDHFTEQYADTWNTLPAQLRQIIALATFKNELRLFLLDNQRTRLNIL